MINKSVDEAVFDSILTRAFRDAVKADMEEDKNTAPVKLTPEHLKAERRAYNKYEAMERQLDKRSIHPRLRRAVSAVLIAGCVGFVTMISIPKVRAAVAEVVIEFFEKYVSFDFTRSGDSSAREGEYTFGYIPDGFELVEQYEDPLTKECVYKDGNGSELSILYVPTKNTILMNDIENAEYSEIEINGYRAYIMDSAAYNNARLLFDDGKNVFTIVGNLPKEEFLKIAENITK